MLEAASHARKALEVVQGAVGAPVRPPMPLRVHVEAWMRYGTHPRFLWVLWAFGLADLPRGADPDSPLRDVWRKWAMGQTTGRRR